MQHAKKLRRYSLSLAVLLSACATPLPMLPETSDVPLPVDSYLAAARSGAAVFRIVPAESVILVRIGRDGAMQRLGHDHAVGSIDIAGYVELGDDPSASRADLAFALRNLVVDDPGHREQLGLGDGPSDADIAGTYANMLKVLQPERYPWVTVRARIATERARPHVLNVMVTLHGATVPLQIPIEFSANGGRITVTGSTVITQSAFGLVPFEAAGGLLSVADSLDISFQLVAAALDAG